MPMNYSQLIQNEILGQTPRIRRKWLVIAGKLIRDGRRRILKLAQDHPLKHLWPLYRFEVDRLW